MPEINIEEFTFAQFSLAAYANLSPGISGVAYTDALLSAGFSPDQEENGVRNSLLTV
jgi:hypothetical protein